MPPPNPANPYKAVADVIAGDGAMLGRLLERLRESAARHAVATTVVPAPLAAQLKPGPLDETGWTLLAANTAVAAKLRHWLPRIEEALAAKGWKPTTIRVHVQGRGP